MVAIITSERVAKDHYVVLGGAHGFLDGAASNGGFHRISCLFHDGGVQFQGFCVCFSVQNRGLDRSLTHLPPPKAQSSSKARRGEDDERQVRVTFGSERTIGLTPRIGLAPRKRILAKP